MIPDEITTLRAQLEDVLGPDSHQGIEFWRFDADCTRAVLAAARQCPLCGGMHYVFINRDGRTRCWSCDDEYLSSLTLSFAEVKR